VWYRIRANLRHVPEDLRPAQATPDPDEDPTRAWREAREAGVEMPEKPKRSRKKKDSAAGSKDVG
jgi:bifunctional non-homologous end joining protein LigD